MTVKEIIYNELCKNKYYQEHPITKEEFEADFLECFDPWEYDQEFDRDSHRWWDEFTAIKRIGNKYFQYTWATANRDESIFELGWDFNENSIVEVEPYTETIEVTKYRIVDNGKEIKA